MIFDVKKIFDSIYKKNKALTVAVLAVLIVALIEILIAVGYKYATILDFTQDNVVVHESRLNNIEKKMVTQDVFSRDVVKRASFNAYIKRKDEEYHEQMEINNSLSSKMGYLEGEVGILSSLLDYWGMPKNTKHGEDNVQFSFKP